LPPYFEIPLEWREEKLVLFLEPVDIDEYYVLEMRKIHKEISTEYPD
jgi:hypothetical protein